MHNFSKRCEDDLNVIFKQWPKIQILDGLYLSTCLIEVVVGTSGADRNLAFLKFKDLLK